MYTVHVLVKNLIFFYSEYSLPLSLSLSQSYASVTLQGLIHFSSSWSLPASHYWLLGDIMIYQRDPLPSSGRHTLYNTSIYNDTSGLTQDNEIIGILKNYQQRNCKHAQCIVTSVVLVRIIILILFGQIFPSDHGL